MYHRLRMAEQSHQRSITKQETLESQIQVLRIAAANATSELKTHSKEAAQAIASLQKTNKSLQDSLSDALSSWHHQIDGVKTRLEKSAHALKESRQEVIQLTKSSKRAAGVLARSVASAKAKVLKERSQHHLMQKGVFTEKTRNVVRLLIKAGCSAAYVNEVISTVLQSAGIDPVGKISRTSIARIVREGFIAAQIQLGHEMQTAQAFTFSADGTGH